PHRERLRRQDRPVIEGRGAVRELERADVVLLGVRREQRRRLPVDAQREAREELGVVVVQAERRRGAGGQAAIVLRDEDDGILLHGDAHQRATSSGFSCSKTAACRSTGVSAPSGSRSRASSMKLATRAKYNGTSAPT